MSSPKKDTHAQHHSAHTPTEPIRMNAAVDPQTGTLDVSGALEMFRQLQTQLAHAAPSPGAAAIYRSWITAERARADGRSISSDRVLAAVMSAYSTLVPALLEQPLPGYGPKRAHYALSLALDHARAYSTFVADEARRAGASQAKHTHVAETRTRRRHLEGLLHEVAHADPALRAKITKAANHGAKRPGELMASVDGLTAVGNEVLASATAQPALAEVLEDMAITRAVVSDAAKPAKDLGTAANEHSTQRTALSAESEALNEFDGRELFELEALERAVQRARELGRQLPELNLAQLIPTHHRVRAAAGDAGAAGGGT